MAPLLGELCENCLKHPSKVRHPNDGVRCDTCLTGDETLRKCNACKLVRYCSRECQKAHWKEHKDFCAINVNIKQNRAKMGVVVAERQIAFEKWCIKNAQHVALASLSAMEIMRDRERAETHVFLLYLDVTCTEEASSKPKFVHSVRKAHCTTLSRVHQMFGSRFSEGTAILDRSLAPRPRLMRILAIDEGLPIPFDLYTLPTDLSDRDAHRTFDAQWFTRLKRSVDG